MSSVQRSPWIIHYDASSCNGCDIEALACLTPLFDVERLGVVNTGNPKHADIFLVTGAVNEQCKSVIQNIYDQMPEPKVVVAVGACAASGGIFRECYNVSGGIDTVIPVDVYVPGCAARPEAIIDGVIEAVGVLAKKQRLTEANPGSMDQTLFLTATQEDAPEILALQRSAYQNEIPATNEDAPKALEQTLAELESDFGRAARLKAVVNGKIIAAARSVLREDVAEISRIMVHPHFRRRGIGDRILRRIEAAYPERNRVAVSVPTQNERDLSWFLRRGYERAKEPASSGNPNWTTLTKGRK